MTAKGEALYAALNGVRDFLSDLGQLLVAGDALMVERSWQPVGDAICLQGLSYSVYEGRRWMPRGAFRQYVNKADYPRFVALISLLLADHRDFELTEPIVSGSSFVFPEGMADGQISVAAWNTYWAGWRQAPLDGSPISITDADPYWKQ